MPLNVSADLLELFNDLTGRPATDSITNAKKYTWLKRAQDEVVSEIASVAPWSLYQKVANASMPTMETTDSTVFTFGTDDDDNPIIPIGKVQIYRNLSDIPNRPLREDVDFISEVSQIRIPGNRTLSGTLYWRGIVMPAELDADNAPALIPPAANELTALRAAINFAESGGLRNTALADRLRLRYYGDGRRLIGRWPYWCSVFKRQFSLGGALNVTGLERAVVNAIKSTAE
jgi:hypothetical protein